MINEELAQIFERMARVIAFKSGDPDAHSTAQLEHIRYGVMQARRGWIEARAAVNTWPWAKLSRWLCDRREVAVGKHAVAAASVSRAS